MRFCFSFLCVLFLLSVPSFCQSQNLELRVYDVEGFARSSNDAAVEHWQLPIRTAYRTREEEPTRSESESDDVSRADFLVRMIRDSIGPESWDQSGTFMRLNESGSRLIIRQKPEVLSKIERFLKTLAASRRRTFQVEILVVKARVGSLASLGASHYVINDKRFESLRAGKNQGSEILSSATGQAVDGQRIRIRSLDIAHLVGAQSGQIAQSATRTEPNVIKVPQGMDIFVRPSSLPDGSVNLRIQGTLTDNFSIENFKSESAGVAAIQLPKLHVRKFTSSGVVAVGDGLVVGCVSSQDQNPRYIVVRVIGKVPATPTLPSIRGLTKVYTAGFLISPYLGTPEIDLGWTTSGPRLFDNWTKDDPIFSSDRNYFLPETAYDLIRQSVTPRFWEDSLYSLEFLGNQLWVTAGPEQHAGIAKLLNSLSAARGTPMSIASYCLVAKRSIVANLRAQDKTDWLRELLRHPGTLRLHSTVGAGETGSRVEWLDGVEFAYVGGAEVDVAQGADIAVPVVEAGFSGFYLRLAACKEGDSFGVDFRVQLNYQPNGVTKQTEYKSGDFGFSLPLSDWQQASGHVRLKRGRYALLAEFGVSDQNVALIVTRLMP